MRSGSPSSYRGSGEGPFSKLSRKQLAFPNTLALENVRPVLQGRVNDFKFLVMVVIEHCCRNTVSVPASLLYGWTRSNDTIRPTVLI